MLIEMKIAHDASMTEQILVRLKFTQRNRAKVDLTATYGRADIYMTTA